MRDYVLVNTTEDLYPKLTTIRYPKVGQANPSSRVGVVSGRGGETRWMDVPGDPRDHYIARMDWAGDSTELVLQHLNRLQNRDEVMLADAEDREGPDDPRRARRGLGRRRRRPELDRRRPTVHLDQRARRLAAPLPRQSGRERPETGHARAVRRDRRGPRRRSGGRGRLHRLARRPEGPLPLPGHARRLGRASAAHADGPAGHAFLSGLARRQMGDPHLFDVEAARR